MSIGLDDNWCVMLAEKHVVFITETFHLIVASCGVSSRENLNSIKLKNKKKSVSILIRIYFCGAVQG